MGKITKSGSKKNRNRNRNRKEQSNIKEFQPVADTKILTFEEQLYNISKILPEDSRKIKLTLAMVVDFTTKLVNLNLNEELLNNTHNSAVIKIYADIALNMIVICGRLGNSLDFREQHNDIIEKADLGNYEQFYTTFTNLITLSPSFKNEYRTGVLLKNILELLLILSRNYSRQRQNKLNDKKAIEMRYNDSQKKIHELLEFTLNNTTLTTNRDKEQIVEVNECLKFHEQDYYQSYTPPDSSSFFKLIVNKIDVFLMSSVIVKTIDVTPKTIILDFFVHLKQTNNLYSNYDKIEDIYIKIQNDFKKGEGRSRQQLYFDFINFLLIQFKNPANAYKETAFTIIINACDILHKNINFAPELLCQMLPLDEDTIETCILKSLMLINNSFSISKDSIQEISNEIINSTLMKYDKLKLLESLKIISIAGKKLETLIIKLPSTLIMLPKKFGLLLFQIELNKGENIFIIKYKAFLLQLKRLQYVLNSKELNFNLNDENKLNDGFKIFDKIIDALLYHKDSTLEILTTKEINSEELFSLLHEVFIVIIDVLVYFSAYLFNESVLLECFNKITLFKNILLNLNIALHETSLTRFELSRFLLKFTSLPLHEIDNLVTNITIDYSKQDLADNINLFLQLNTVFSNLNSTNLPPVYQTKLVELWINYYNQYKKHIILYLATITNHVPDLNLLTQVVESLKTIAINPLFDDQQKIMIDSLVQAARLQLGKLKCLHELPLLLEEVRHSLITNAVLDVNKYKQISELLNEVTFDENFHATLFSLTYIYTQLATLTLNDSFAKLYQFINNIKFCFKNTTKNYSVHLMALPPAALDFVSILSNYLLEYSSLVPEQHDLMKAWINQLLDIFYKKLRTIHFELNKNNQELHSEKTIMQLFLIDVITVGELLFKKNKNLHLKEKLEKLHKLRLAINPVAVKEKRTVTQHKIQYDCTSNEAPRELNFNSKNKPQGLKQQEKTKSKQAWKTYKRKPEIENLIEPTDPTTTSTKETPLKQEVPINTPTKPAVKVLLHAPGDEKTTQPSILTTAGVSYADVIKRHLPVSVKQQKNSTNNEYEPKNENELKTVPTEFKKLETTFKIYEYAFNLIEELHTFFNARKKAFPKAERDIDFFIQTLGFYHSIYRYELSSLYKEIRPFIENDNVASDKYYDKFLTITKKTPLNSLIMDSPTTFFSYTINMIIYNTAKAVIDISALAKAKGKIEYFSGQLLHNCNNNTQLYFETKEFIDQIQKRCELDDTMKYEPTPVSLEYYFTLKITGLAHELEHQLRFLNGCYDNLEAITIQELCRFKITLIKNRHDKSLLIDLFHECDQYGFSDKGLIYLSILINAIEPCLDSIIELKSLFESDWTLSSAKLKKICHKLYEQASLIQGFINDLTIELYDLSDSDWKIFLIALHSSLIYYAHEIQCKLIQDEFIEISNRSEGEAKYGTKYNFFQGSELATHEEPKMNTRYSLTRSY